VERRRAQLEQSVARYLSQLDSADRQEPSEAPATKTTRLQEKLAKLAEEMQVAVDTEHYLIVTHEVTNVGSDRAQLARVAKKAKAGLQTDTLEAVADRGYFSGAEIVACDQAGITVTLPKPMTSGAKARRRFGKQDFAYLPADDVYRCPAGERLKYYYTNVENGLKLHLYWTNACRTCALKSRCTTGVHAGSHGGSTSMCYRLCSGGSTRIRRPCVGDARRSSIPSARSRPGWEQPTS
jgi:hypothetical protein